MTKLVRMSMMGVRSFGPENEDEQVITFTSPLTLFLGQNGCGKTTIIECLKFACTDELPSGGGKDFVNDPSLSGNMSTKGKIKLELASNNGDTMTVIRVFTVEMKPKSMSFQRLDNSFIFRKKGYKVQQSNSVTVDEFVRISCGVLGVSKSIINHVLFCHQEDSLWPLDSPKTVKETFDKIFDATKYNKAVDHLMKLTKKNKILLKTYFERKECFRRDKYYTDNERLKLNEKESKLEDVKIQIKDKLVQLKPVEVKLTELSVLQDNLRELEKKCSAKETEAIGFSRQIEEIRNSLQEEYEGDDESLQRDINSFEDLETKWKQNLDTLSKSKDKLTTDHNLIEKQIRSAQDKTAQLKFAIDSNANQVKERNQLISNCETEYNIPHNSLDSKSDIVDAVSKLKKGYKLLQDYNDTYLQSLEEDEQKRQNNVETLFKDMISLDQEVKLKTAQMIKFNEDMVELQDQLQDLKVSNKKMAQFQAEIARMNKDIDRISQTFKPEEAERHIQTNKQEIKDLKATLESLENDYDVIRENHATGMLLQNLECSVISKQTEIEKIKNKHSAYFDTVFGSKTANFNEIVLTMQRQHANKIAAVAQRITNTQKKLTEHETICRSKKSKLQDMIREYESCDKEVEVVCKGKPYPVIKKELEEEVDNLQSDKGQYTSAKIVYSKFIKVFESEKPCCPICATDFKNKQDSVGQIIQSLKGRIQSVPEELMACTEQLKIAQDKFNRVLKLETINKRVLELSDNMKSVQIEIATAADLVVSEKKNLNQLQEELKEPEKAKEIADKLVGDASLLDKSYKDLQSFESEREILQAQLITVHSAKSMEETKIEISEFKDNISRREHDLELEQRKLQQTRSKLQELKDRRATENEKRLNLQKNMQGQPQLEEQYAKLQADKESMTSEIAELKLKITTAKELHDDGCTDYELVKATNKAEIANLRADLVKQKCLLENIEDIQRKIEIFESKAIGTLYGKSIEDADELQARKSTLAANVERIIKQTSDIEKKIAGQKHELRILTDNSLLREKIVLRDKIIKESDALKMKIDGQNYQKLLKDKQMLHEQWQDLTNEVGKFKGQYQELQLSIEELKKFLEQPENKHAHKNYLNMCYKVIILEKATSDIVVFMRAIEKSVLSFHTDRMKQINKTIRNLWRTIYQGNDIESIRIKTDNVTTNVARRTYNYSVMQVKNGVEIEMRGRCSAGQKVLACLIIRMALAETFSLHCGILALDEPTTNLDRQNIISLSDALVKLIEDREKDKNFQLLIITHDEEFLSTLQRTSTDNFYYYVTRNSKGFTRIKKSNMI